MNASTTPIPTLEESNQDAEKSLQMVGFRLGNEEYGVEINKVREIILVGEITQVPETPPFVKGLINLRSTVIPIIDLKLRFGLMEMPRTDETRIVVLNVAGKTIGIIVDAVNEVIRISVDQIAPPPPAVAGLDQEHLVGLAKLEDRLLILLDIENILNDETETENAPISIN
jgi:purine-binding chemotaxis protein CheW